jgi:hypothetical protein
MEDRSFLWRDCYQESRKTWHLGVDYWVPTGTEVRLPVAAGFTHSRVDEDKLGGWGGQVFAELPAWDHEVWPWQGKNAVFAIFAHLDKDGLLSGLKYKQPIPSGTVVGKVAPRETNGGWEPHLHVQLVSWAAFHKMPSGSVSETLERVDGYGNLYDCVDLDYPRPELMLELTQPIS